MITSDVLNEAIRTAEDFLREFFKRSGREVDITSKAGDEGDSLVITISGEKASDFIGTDGNVLDSLQYVTSLAVNKKSEDFVRILIDIEGYREKRRQDLIRTAIESAELVKAEGNPVSLPPMNPYERRIIHMTLQDDEDIKTESQGREPERYLVIMPAE